MAKLANRIFATAAAGAFLMIAMFFLVKPLLKFDRSQINALSLTHEKQIRNIASKLLNDAASGSSSSGESLAILKEIMIKLRDGWPEFTRDNYYPHDYTSQDLLGSIYWDVAKEASNCDSVECKHNLVQLLVATAPKSNGKPLGSYSFAIQNHNLRTQVEQTGTDPVSENDQ